VAEPPVQFSGVLRRLRSGAGLTQEELAEAAGLSSRAVSDLERGIVATPHKNTVRLLADALHLRGVTRAEFEAVARARALARMAAASIGKLPRDIDSFAGRRPELAELEDEAVSAGESARVVVIHAIDGMAGVGKTAFAVHAAHRLAERFPGGQIFLPLHGHTPGQQPASPAEALATLLLVIGVPAAQVPAGLEARAGLWRDRVAERRLLLVLDDATDSEQVRPLLPGTGGSMVLVTSRRRLSALEDARTVSLGVLPPQDAAALLVRLAERPGLEPSDPAIAAIARLCGYLPLAIGMLGRRLHHDPSPDIGGRATELADAVSRLDLLATGNTSVAAAFDLSYENLTPGHQRLFRRLGLHPGAEIDAYAAAALDATGLPTARRGLEVLYDQHLLTEQAPGRYRMHDLIREYARTLVGRLEADGERRLATGRLLDYSEQAAALADVLLARQARTVPVPATQPKRAVPALADREHALAWVRAERASLLACLEQVTFAGQHARVVALTSGLAGILRHDGPWAEAISRHATALSAARHLGDRAGEAGALASLGRVRQLTGDYPGAIRDLQEALDTYRDLGDRPGQAGTLTNLGEVHQLAGDFPAGARDLEEALAIHRDLGDRPGQAAALGSLGRVRQLTGDYPGAARDMEEALVIYRDAGDLRGQADTLLFLGNVRQVGGDHQGAARYLEEALAIYRDRDHRLGQANALNFLGRVRRLTGDYPGAASDLREALGIYRAVGDRGGEVSALNEAGALSRVRGELGEATAYNHQALKLARAIGSAWDEAHALAGLGRNALAVGRTTEARRTLRQALAIFEQIGAAEATELSAELGVRPACLSRRSR
jgi:tetratricopeptide (TPR) repeat protein/transcriptional regulator with XRE-family HTH domain